MSYDQIYFTRPKWEKLPVGYNTRVYYIWSRNHEGQY